MAKKSPKNDPTSQQYEVGPIDDIQPHPRNPNKGDSAAIRESLDENGFYGAVIVQRSTGYILIGNHRWAEEKAAGATEIPRIYLDVDDKRALKIMLADNATRQGASIEEKILADILKDLPDGRGTGYQPAQIDELLKAARPSLSYLDSMRGSPSVEGEDCGLDDQPSEDGPFDGEDEDDSDVRPPPEHEDMPRHMLAIVLSNAERRIWKRAQERLGKKKDKDAFMAMLSLYDAGG